MAFGLVVSLKVIQEILTQERLNDGLDWKKAIRLEIECQTRDCKGECGKDLCGKCYAREKPFERMKAVRKDLRKARRKRKLELRKEMLKQYVDEMFD